MIIYLSFFRPRYLLNCFLLFSFQGWWLVDREGELGWAPASHLEPTDDGLEITTARTFAPGKGKLGVASIISKKFIIEEQFWNEIG